MTTHDFKRGTGSLRAGFAYQDLVAIEVLIDFVRDRDRFEWVRVEAEGEEFQAIDDVVACRKDGTFELTQVKFTPDPTSPRHHLDWGWLTDRKPRGTSLIQKWAKTTLAHVSNGTLARAMLKTDRVPSVDFGRCLSGARVDLESVPMDVRRTLEQQIGVPGDASTFFQSFEFVHSQEHLDDYEETLRARLQHELDAGGWAKFKHDVYKWATRRNKPGPDGKIRHFHLMRIFSPERPTALPQDFVVPSGYDVPDQDFHATFVTRCATTDGVAVLWGPPGRGKSTYLSHCVANWAKADDLVAIRHHYYLHLEDRSEGRFSYFAIDRSLRQQIRDAGLPVGENSSGLGDAVACAATAAVASGKRLVIVVDGLDHVWREGGDIGQMEELFRGLLPLPAGVRLVVGTQRVEDRQLPVSLLKVLPKEQWTELPTMSVDAVRRWLALQVRAGRVPVEETKLRTSEEIIEALGAEFHSISGGLPLHLVYSLEALLETGRPLTVDAVAAMPLCPSGNIEVYYESLWVRLAPASKRVLHLLAGLAFAPPAHGLRTCLPVDWPSVVDEIGHLLEFRDASVSPFHSSLFAFLRRRSEHKSDFDALATNVVRWLEVEAPDYWRRAWLWVMKARLGDATPLLRGPTYRWAVEWLKDAYPVDHLVYMVGAAEEAALAAGDFVALMRLRSIKTSALNARDYQTEDWGGFFGVALALSKDVELRAVLRDNIPMMKVDELIAVAEPRSSICERVIHELNRRIVVGGSDGLSGRERRTDAIVRVVAREGVARVEKVVEYAEKNDNEDLIEEYARESIRAGNYGDVLAIGRLRSGHELDRLTLAALCLEGIGPKRHGGLAGAGEPGLQCLALLMGEECDGHVPVEDIASLPGPKEWTAELPMIRTAGYRAFFGALAAALSGGVAEGRTKCARPGAETWLYRSFQQLERVAGQAGANWLQSKRWPTLGDVYSSFSLPLPMKGSLDLWLIGVRLALLDIAVDLCAIGIGALQQQQIDREDVRTASASPFWLTELWLGAFHGTPLPLHSTGGAEAILALVSADMEGRVIQFDERSATLTKAARFAFDHDLSAPCHAELEKASECLLGYGWRKDMFVFEVINALRMFADRGDAEAKSTILSLSREVEGVTEYTDGDETDGAREELHQKVIDYFPERVPQLYAYLIRRQEWWRAEQLSTRYAERLVGESRADQALLATYLTPDEQRAALEASSKMGAGGVEVQQMLMRLSGRELANTLVRHQDGGSSSKEVLDVGSFAPGNLNEMLESVKGETSLLDKDLVSQWLTYWDGKERTADALTDFETLLSEKPRDYHVSAALDTAFEVCRRHEGRTRAYRWLVRANADAMGWHRWWSAQENFEKRVRWFVADYRERWRDFVIETSRREVFGGPDDNGIEVGMSRLVYFLIEVGQVELARELTGEMVRIFREQVASQPLTTPDWAQ